MFIHFRHKATGRLYWSVRLGRVQLSHNPVFTPALIPWGGGAAGSRYLYFLRFCLDIRPKTRQPEDPRHSAVDSPLAPNDGWRVEE